MRLELDANIPIRWHTISFDLVCDRLNLTFSFLLSFKPSFQLLCYLQRTRYVPDKKTFIFFIHRGQV